MFKIKELEKRIDLLEKEIEHLKYMDKLNTKILSSQQDINFYVYEEIQKLKRLIKSNEENSQDIAPDENQISFDLNEEGDK
ncbi:MAG: hypothetical protein E7391_09155 [Ruminococcaceae bacterium]|nr:hypothetical protein [Oscillospiraceae bacterium]